MARFANPALQHKTAQIAMDGSQKIPQRLLASIREARAREMPHGRLMAGVAAWVQFVGQGPVEDPLGERLAGASAQEVLGFQDVFGDLTGDTAFRDGVLALITDMDALGMDAFVNRLA